MVRFDPQFISHHMLLTVFSIFSMGKFVVVAYLTSQSHVASMWTVQEIYLEQKCHRRMCVNIYRPNQRRIFVGDLIDWGCLLMAAKIMFSFHRSRLRYDHHIWATLPGLRREICTGRQWAYMWPPVALMVVANIKCVWYLVTTSMTKSPNLIVRIRSPQVTAGRWRLTAVAAGWICDPSVINTI